MNTYLTTLTVASGLLVPISLALAWLDRRRFRRTP